MQSVPITTSFVASSNSTQEVYSIQHYVIKFVSDLSQVGSFLRALPWFLKFPTPIRLPPYSWNIAESGVKHNNHYPLDRYILRFISPRNIPLACWIISSKQMTKSTITWRHLFSDNISQLKETQKKVKYSTNENYSGLYITYFSSYTK